MLGRLPLGKIVGAILNLMRPSTIGLAWKPVRSFQQLLREGCLCVSCERESETLYNELLHITLWMFCDPTAGTHMLALMLVNILPPLSLCLFILSMSLSLFSACLCLSVSLFHQERHLLVKVIDRVLYKLDDLVRPFVHKVSDSPCMSKGFKFVSLCAM